MSKQRYAIIGSGALGGLYGGMLARGGHEVHFLLNSDFDHVRQHGLKVDTIWGDFVLPNILAHRHAESLPPCDVTIVALKTTNNHLLAELLPPPTRDGGVVLVLQNGLGIESDSAAIVGDDRVLTGCCFLCSNKIGPGHIHHLDYGRIVFGEFLPKLARDSTRAETICSDLAAAGVDAQTADDLHMVRWRKLMWNIPFNGLSVVLNASTKQIMDDPHAEALADSLIRDVHAAAAVCGAEIPNDMIEKTMSHTRTMVPYDSSMRVDFLNKRPIEVEAIIGNPLRAAQAAGAAVPRLESLYHQLRYLDAANRV